MTLKLETKDKFCIPVELYQQEFPSLLVLHKQPETHHPSVYMLSRKPKTDSKIILVHFLGQVLVLE